MTYTTWGDDHPEVAKMAAQPVHTISNIACFPIRSRHDDLNNNCDETGCREIEGKGHRIGPLRVRPKRRLM